MTGNQLLNKFSDVDPKLITGAENIKKKNRKGLFIGLGSGLAATAAALALVIGLNSVKVEEPVIDFSKYTHLPVITASSEGISGMGGGHSEEWCSKDELEKLKTRLKASQDETSKFGYKEFETLPIYMSLSNTPDLDKMKARLLEIAAKLGYSESDLKLGGNSNDLSDYRKMLEDQGVPQDEIEAEIERIHRQTDHMADVTADNDDIRLSITTDFTVDIFFKRVRSLPNDCSLASKASDEEKGKAVEFLYNEYKTLVDYDKTVRIGTGIHNNSSYAESKLEYIEFFGDNDSGRSSCNRIRIYSAEGCENLGDYPIMNEKSEDAELKSENIPEDERMPEDAEILGVTFHYPSNQIGKTGLIPYYSFYVMTDKEPPVERAEYTVDIYTIYAVPERFISFDTEDRGIGA